MASAIGHHNPTLAVFRHVQDAERRPIEYCVGGDDPYRNRWIISPARYMLQHSDPNPRTEMLGVTLKGVRASSRFNLQVG